MSRFKDLCSLLIELEAPTPNSKEFSRVLGKGLEASQVTEKAFAQELSVSTPTVNRWVRGANAPHPAFRLFVLGALKAHIQRRLLRTSCTDV